MATTTPYVLDSAEWAFREFQTEILGELDPMDEDYDLLCDAATRSLAWELSLHWLIQGHVATLVSKDEYGRRTWSDEAINETASSYVLPDEDEALTTWETVAASITADEVRQFAGLA